MEKDYFFDRIIEICMDEYLSGGSRSVFELAEECMDIEGMPIHCPPHHLMVPAVLLTAVHRANGDLSSVLKEDLEEADRRAHQVPGGFCGNFGDCGAAVGVGIFMSIYTKTGPCSGDSWALTNRATAEALMRISAVSGPRCCKRVSWLALLSACETVKKDFDIELAKPKKIFCKYYSRNEQCKKDACPFYPAAQRNHSSASGEINFVVPETAYPVKDPEHPCPCQSRPFSLKGKQGCVTLWKKKPGDSVENGESICEGEAEFKSLEFTSPAKGILKRIRIAEGETFKAGDVFGTIEGES